MRKASVQFRLIETHWGTVGLVGSGAGLCRLLLPGPSDRQMRVIKSGWPTAMLQRDSMDELARSIGQYFRGRGRIVKAPVDLRGLSKFARETLEFVRQIPYGTTMSYQQVARAVCGPGHCRAVGQVLKNNPVPLVVPCHRVIRSDGQLGGFSAAGAAATKRQLLKLEGAL